MTPRTYKRELNRLDAAIMKITVILASQTEKLNSADLERYRRQRLNDLYEDRKRLMQEFINIQRQPLDFAVEIV